VDRIFRLDLRQGFSFRFIFHHSEFKKINLPIEFDPAASGRDETRPEANASCAWFRTSSLKRDFTQLAQLPASTSSFQFAQ
jgi:hypothetical protein